MFSEKIWILACNGDARARTCLVRVRRFREPYGLHRYYAQHNATVSVRFRPIDKRLGLPACHDQMRRKRFELSTAFPGGGRGVYKRSLSRRLRHYSFNDSKIRLTGKSIAVTESRVNAVKSRYTKKNRAYASMVKSVRMNIFCGAP